MITTIKVAGVIAVMALTALSMPARAASDKFVSINFDQRTYHAGDTVNFFVTVVNHPTNANLVVQVEGSVALDQGTAESVALSPITEDTSSYSLGPITQGEYVFTVSVFLQDRVQGGVTKVEDRSVTLGVDLIPGGGGGGSGGGGLSVLQQGMLKTMRHMVLIQNNDFGWTFETDNPDSLRNKTNISEANQFGVCGMGLVDAYGAVSEASIIPAIYNAAQFLTTKVVTKTTRMYPTDADFLMRAWSVLGFDSYKTQAQTAIRAESDFSAAMHVLNNVNPTAEEVNALTQEQIDAVSLADRATALNSRFATNRGTNLMIYDMGTRAHAALTVGEQAWSLELARQIKADFSTHYDANQYYALAALAYVVIGLEPFAGTTEFDPTIAQATQALLAFQESSGQFLNIGPAGEFNGGLLADQGYVLGALASLGNQTAAMNTLLQFLVSTQLPSGRWDDFGYESVESQAEVLSSMSLAVSKGATLSTVRPVPYPTLPRLNRGSGGPRPYL